MRPILLAAAMTLALPAAMMTPAIAQMPTEAPGKPDPALAQSGTYTVDTGHTQVLFTVSHLGFTFYTGQFTQPTGTLVLDAKDPARSKVDIRFPIAKVSTTVTGLDEHLQKPEFFDAAKFPEGRFVSTAIAVDGTHARIAGDLTLRGVTRPVTLDATFVGAGPGMMDKKLNLGFAATTRIRRSDFGIAYGIPLVSDEVALTINAGFVKE